MVLTRNALDAGMNRLLRHIAAEYPTPTQTS